MTHVSSDLGELKQPVSADVEPKTETVGDVETPVAEEQKVNKKGNDE